MSGTGLDFQGLSPSPVICIRICNKSEGTSKFFSLKLNAPDKLDFISELNTGIGIHTPWAIQGSVVYVCSLSAGTAEVSSIDVNGPTERWGTCPSMLVGRDGALTASVGGKIFVMGGKSTNIGNDDDEPNSWTKAFHYEPNPLTEVFDPISNSWEPHPLPEPLPDTHYSLTFRAVDPAGQYLIVGNSCAFVVFDGYAKRWQLFGQYAPVSPLKGSGLFIDKTIILVYNDVLQSYHICRKEYSDGKILGLQALGSSDSRKEPNLFHLGGSIYDYTAGARFALVWSGITSAKSFCVYYTKFWAVLRKHHDFLSLEAVVESCKSFPIDPDPHYSRCCHFGGALIVSQTKKRKGQVETLREIFKEKLTKQVSVHKTPPVSQKICFRVYNENDDVSRFYHVNLSMVGITGSPTRGIRPTWELKTGRQSSWVMHGSVLYVLGGYSTSSNSSEASEHNHVFCIDTDEQTGGGMV
ncbi:Galactose oxidase, beta-propeller [Corchorus olitorius]|uniref:Galactose oxidase, beta-propeller n=1 Tax=Corchorus olitorius TaxID=93759 RepID=A0A1R3H3S5_9ROSI|nr:Galactose oxidase, beta-propeller [Corchorus olitorius]